MQPCSNLVQLYPTRGLDSCYLFVEIRATRRTQCFLKPQPATNDTNEKIEFCQTPTGKEHYQKIL